MATTVIPWTRDGRAASVKIAADERVKMIFEERGCPREEILTRWKEFSKGMFGDKQYTETEEWLDHMFPEFRELYERWEHIQPHKERYGHTVFHRGTRSVEKEETSRFRCYEWLPLYHFIKERVRSSKSIDFVEIYKVHEEIILKMSRGKPGVYINISPYSPTFYLGEAADVYKRNKSHKNSDHSAGRVYITQTKQDALYLQNAIYDQLKPVITFHRNCSTKIGNQGAIRIERGVDPVVHIDEIVKTYYRHWCRATIGFLNPG